MKILKQNTESTVLERLRIVIGILLALGGLVMIALNFISSSSDVISWSIGLSLVIIGFIVAGSHKIMMLVLELFR